MCYFSACNIVCFSYVYQGVDECSVPRDGQSGQPGGTTLIIFKYIKALVGRAGRRKTPHQRFDSRCKESSLVYLFLCIFQLASLDPTVEFLWPVFPMYKHQFSLALTLSQLGREDGERNRSHQGIPGGVVYRGKTLCSQNMNKSTMHNFLSSIWASSQQWWWRCGRKNCIHWFQYKRERGLFSFCHWLLVGADGSTEGTDKAFSECIGCVL